MSILATSEMCFYCFDVLHYEFANRGSLYVKNGKKRKTPSNAPNPDHYAVPDNVECPLFVGWKKERKQGGQKLRGCKGTHGILPMHEGLKQYALLSAFDDSRFSQVTEDEIPRLTCTVSLLFAFEEAKDCYDWEVGIHGIRIDFIDSDGVQRSATFLPHVAEQFGYTRKQTIERLVEKSGCEAPLTKKMAKKIKTIRFQASSSAGSYEEYLRYIQSKNKTSNNGQ